MKTLTFQIALPLSIISFLFFTKWWYASLIEMDNIILYGFPLIYMCKGFHTSPIQRAIFVYLNAYTRCVGFSLRFVGLKPIQRAISV